MSPYAHINETPVFVVERHSDVIVPWAFTRRLRGVAPQLVTLDYHTDTMLPFLRWAYRRPERTTGKATTEDLAASRLKRLDYMSDASVADAARELWHDEHIRAALGADILRQAVVISIQRPGADQRVPGIVYFSVRCQTSCARNPHDELCERELADFAIDDALLRAPVDAVAFDDFILDIDLDYFRTLSALSPNHIGAFSRLVKGARCITIATEPSWVEQNRLDEQVTHSYLLDKLLTRMGELPGCTLSRESD